MIISINAEKPFVKIQHAFIIKLPRKLGTEFLPPNIGQLLKIYS